MSRILKTGDNQVTYKYNMITHKGIDIVKYKYQLDDIIAHTDGEVVEVVKNYKTVNTKGNNYGNYVKIKHSNGYYTLYAHLKYGSVKVSKGDKVSKGQVIGYMGNTGYTKGTHLHFEVRNTKDTRINPTPYINADLPSVPKKITCEYRVWDNVKKQWLPKVQDKKDYAGNIGNDIGGFQLITNGGGVTKIRTHLRNGSWLEEVVDGGFKEGANNYSGIKGREIDAIIIWSQYGDATYRVHTKKSGWLPWVNGSDVDDFINGYAGNFGEEIDAIQCYIK